MKITYDILYWPIRVQTCTAEHSNFAISVTTFVVLCCDPGRTSYTRDATSKVVLGGECDVKLNTVITIKTRN